MGNISNITLGRSEAAGQEHRALRAGPSCANRPVRAWGSSKGKTGHRVRRTLLILAISALLLCGTAYAADDAGEPTSASSEVTATLYVNEVWLTGDTLHITVTNVETEETQTLELDLRNYTKPSDEYITVQATDGAGNTSNTLQFKNPYFEDTAGAQDTQDTADASATPATPSASPTTSPTVTDAPEDSISATPEGEPLTPDGTGTVLDNVTSSANKEFFTVETADGNVFYIIVDRERESDNVYLLNAVNEDDLWSLAKDGNGIPVSAVASESPTPTPQVSVEPTPSPEPEPAQEKSGNNNLLLIGLVVAAIGGAAYYFKVIRPKKNAASETTYSGDFDNDEELDVDDDERDGDDE